VFRRLSENHIFRASRLATFNMYGRDLMLLFRVNRITVGAPFLLHGFVGWREKLFCNHSRDTVALPPRASDDPRCNWL